MISLIAAMDKQRVIGHQGSIPWHLPSDLKHFKAMTLNKPIVMGRTTFDSIGRALPGRRNIVLSRQTDLLCAGCEVFSSLDDVFEATQDDAELMIIGGETLYKQCLPMASRLYLTLIDEVFPGDTFFPEWEANEWQEVSRESSEEKGLRFVYVTLERTS